MTRYCSRARRLAAGIKIGYFTADDAYGDNPALRAWLEGHQVNYAMTISRDTPITSPTGTYATKPTLAEATTSDNNSSATPCGCSSSRSMTSKAEDLFVVSLLARTV